jgi:hypothetical protein
VKQEQLKTALLLLQYQTPSCVLMDGLPKPLLDPEADTIQVAQSEKHTLFAIPVQFLRIRFFFSHQIKVILYLGRIFFVN